MADTLNQRSSAAVPLSDDMRAALAPVVGRTEQVDLVASGVGCTLVLTDRHLVLVRDGAHFRPRSGVRAWHLEQPTSVRLTPAHHATSRLVISDGERSASVFVTAEQQADVQELVAAVRRQTHASAKESQAGRPA